VNASHWLSQSKARGAERKERFTRADVEAIAEAGLDHIRIPVDEVQLWDDAGAKDREAFDLLDDALDWCEAAGMRAVVDLHITRSHYFNDPNIPRLWIEADETETFVELWRQLSAHLRGRSEDLVAYELLNEPVAPDPRDWNRVAAAAHAAIRDGEPTRIIVLGSNDFSQPITFDDLAIPDDRNLILTFHFYRPMLITHYTASWTRTKDYHGPVRYPGVPIAEGEWQNLAPPVQESLREWNIHFNATVLADLLSQPLAARECTGLRLYCGEFGCMSTAPEPARSNWFRDVIGLFKREQIAWAVWDYQGPHFGMFTPDRQKRPFADILLA
jgi:endoglucanase